MKVVRDDNEMVYTDVELINTLKENGDNLHLLYKRHKSYCINFMKSMYNDHEEIKDIYHDAVIVLYEKINKSDFELTCSIQTFLNTVCRNQIYKRINHSNRYKINEAEENDSILKSITDTLEEFDDVNNERIKVMKKVFEEMKETSSKCYEMLMRFWYKNQTMDYIATNMQFAHSDSAKSQKAKCQKQFKTEVYKRVMLWAK
jgi:RNA polymerase sigma factor (sigma-70 family)